MSEFSPVRVPAPPHLHSVLFTQCVSGKYITPKYTHQHGSGVSRSTVWPQAGRQAFVHTRRRGRADCLSGCGLGRSDSGRRPTTATPTTSGALWRVVVLLVLRSVVRLFGLWFGVCTNTKRNNRNSVVCAFIPSWPPPPSHRQTPPPPPH